jgi:RimJ/RimL family protein N-acetyltransferase
VRQPAGRFRPATEADAYALCRLERAANLAALGHVFPPERYPFPDDAVLSRWFLVLADEQVDVLVVDGEAGLVCYAAHDDDWLRHLAVHPAHWGRGLGAAAVEAATAAMAARGAREVSLWCLEENRRARRHYERLGWRPADERREASWPPYPVEMRYVRALGG